MAIIGKHRRRLWTDAGKSRRRITSQISKHWSCHLLVAFYVSCLCSRTPSANACQRERLPNHCFWEYEDEYQPCPMSDTDKVGCIYAKINSTVTLLSSEDSEKFTSQPRGFAIKTYTSYFQSVHGCGHIFNITWTLPQDASVDYLQGFLLDITFDNMGEPQRFLRHFEVLTKELTAKDLSQIVFHYDCFVPRPNTFFHIRLRSLPIAPFGMTNDVWQNLQTYDNGANVDANNTGNWKASIWVNSPDVSPSSVLEICFTTAPLDFRFARYKVYLLSSGSSNNLRLIRYLATVEVDQTEPATDACCKVDVCPDTYRIEIEPESDDGPDCKCKLESKCVADCETSVFERADMTHSMSICSPTISPTSVRMTNMSTSISSSEVASKNDLRKICGVVVGIFLGFLVFGLLGFLVWKKNRKPTKPDPKRVFILDSSDTHDLQVYVRFLADSLRRRFHCEVHVLSDCLGTDDQSNLDIIWNGIVNADCIIFLMSDACRRRYRDVMKGVIRPPSGRTSVINNAVVAMLMQLMYSSDFETVRRKCFEVCLPGKSKCHELEKTVQRSYCFPGEIADLVWEVRGVKQPRFNHVNILKLLERWKVKRDWKMNRVALNDQTPGWLSKTSLLENAPVHHEYPVQNLDQYDGDSSLLNNNNRDSFDDLHLVLNKERQAKPPKKEVFKTDSGFSGSVVLDLMEIFLPPLSRPHSSSTLSSSNVGHDDDSLFGSSYDFSTTSTHDDDDEYPA